MSRFTPKVTAQFEFDGDKITATLRRLQNKHMVLLGPIFMDKSLPALFRTVKIVQEARDVFTENVKLEGLRNSSNEVMELEQILDETYFAPLLDMVLAELFRISTVQGVAEEKKSDPPPPAASSSDALSSTSSAVL